MRSEIALIAALRRDGRASLMALSKATGMPVSTVHMRLKKFVPVVCPRFVGLLHFSALAFNIRAIAWVKAGKNKLSLVRDSLRKSELVNTAWEVSSTYDFVAEVVGHGLREIEEFRDTLRMVGAVQVGLTYVMGDVAREKVLTMENALTNVPVQALRKSFDDAMEKLK